MGYAISKARKVGDTALVEKLVQERRQILSLTATIVFGVIASVAGLLLQREIDRRL